MIHARQAARELTLRVLFQREVGKQPLDEVLEGGLAQVRRLAENPVAQVFLETERALQQTLHEVAPARKSSARTQTLPPPVSTQTARLLRQAVSLATTEIRALADSLRDLLHEAIAPDAVLSFEGVMAAANARRAVAETNIRRIAARETLRPDVVASLVETASAGAERMLTVFERHLIGALPYGAYAVMLVQGVQANQAAIDRQVAALSTDWALDRQPAADRCILRIAAYEILFGEGVPVGVAINEAVELAKKYSTEESGRFVNGILGTVAEQTKRTVKAAPVPETMENEPLVEELPDMSEELPDTSEDA